MTIDERAIAALEWRLIGPFRGGRSVAVAGHPTDRLVFYFGACDGGVWKTTDGGIYWRNVSDGWFNTASIGAVAVSESDPSVVYAGTGEACIRGNVSHGDGVYRSTDDGASWAHFGLEDTRHISRVRVHPLDSDLVYVSALGNIYGPNEERGVFRSSDGGRSWERVLFRSPTAGAADLSLDHTNPRVLYATIWDASRTPWNLTSGGPDSGLYRSVDGGDTWAEITRNPGMPEGVLGRMGVAASPARPWRVWALVQAEKGGLFLSDDGGDTWERVSDYAQLNARAWYYGHVIPDPQDADTVYIPNEQVWKSVDGGRTLSQMPTPHGDNHDLWVDSNDPERMIEGNDGGACVSFDSGASWSSLYNQPTAQFYHLATDGGFPYRVYGTQQDNTAISVPSRSARRSRKSAITWSECYEVGDSECGHIAVRPDDPNIVYSGGPPEGGKAFTRYDHRTGQQRAISVWPELYGGVGVEQYRHRFQWTFPITISPHNPGVLYVAANVVFRSDDEGQSWVEISPDLTRNDPTKLGPSGGPLAVDQTGVENYCTVFAFVESPHERGVYWAGSDDGLVHVSLDGGESWANVTPPSLPEWSTVTTIEVSPHDPASAYVAAVRYKLDDHAPYVYKTSDYGETWRSIGGGLGEDRITRVVREDPARRGLLYAGTESGVSVSTDDGVSWTQLQLNLPVVPVHDLAVKDGDLVAATHGRSFWVLDDLSPLRQSTELVTMEDVHLFEPRAAYRLNPGASAVGSGKWPAPGRNLTVAGGTLVAHYERLTESGDRVTTFLNAGANPPAGAVVSYWLSKKPEDPVSLTFLDSRGEVVRRFSSEASSDESEPRVPNDAGTNRFVWDLRHEGPLRLEDDITTARVLIGPMAAPGEYTVRLDLGDESRSTSFRVRMDPRVSANLKDLDRQLELSLRIKDRLSEIHSGVVRLRRVRDQVEEWAKGREDPPNVSTLAAAARILRNKLAGMEWPLIQPAARAPQDGNYMPAGLNAKLVELFAVVANADAAPTQQSCDLFGELSDRVDHALGTLQEMVDTDIAAFNALVTQAGLPAVAFDR